jgi:23S rRNA (cytosine1962-C5)-methyltransferase
MPSFPVQRSLSLPSKLPGVEAKSVGLHPLIYRKRIERASREVTPGDVVEVSGPDGKLAGYGLYNPKAELVLRVISGCGELPDEAFWKRKLAEAVKLRRELLRLDDTTDAYRVIHAEADGLSGLVIDKLGDVLSAECFSLGTSYYRIRPGPATLAQEGFEGEELSSPDAPPRVTIQEFGTRFRVEFAESHKTGFFCDQRDNRRMLATFCKDKSVLDLCCYTGGFAVQAKKLGGAGEVIGVDLDGAPLAVARENANLNQVRVKFVQADAFAYMRDMLANNRRFDVVVLDPPKLIRSRAELEEGTKKHFDLNRLAMRLVAPGGIMLSCTCAGLLTPDEFLRMIYASARQAGEEVSSATADRYARHAARHVQILAKTGAAADHPIAANCPETEYLQAVWMRVM